MACGSRTSLGTAGLCPFRGLAARQLRRSLLASQSPAAILAASWVRFFTSSFPRMLETCRSTVLRDRNSVRAMSGLLAPPAMRFAISRSRSLRLERSPVGLVRAPRRHVRTPSWRSSWSTWARSVVAPVASAIAEASHRTVSAPGASPRPPSRARGSCAPRSIRCPSPVGLLCQRCPEAGHDPRALLRRGPIGLVGGPTLEGRPAAARAPPPRTSASPRRRRRCAPAIQWPP